MSAVGDAGIGACVAIAQSMGADPEEYCLGGEAGEDVTPGHVAVAVWSMDLPASELIIQPPDGKTLVNFDTNFYTEPTTIRERLRLLGRDVDVRITAESWTWHFGDGEVLTTTTPGSSYPDLEVTHTYLAKETFEPWLETTYRAEYRIDDGPWQQVSGSAVVPGDPQELQVIGARPVLVAPDGS